MNCQDFETVVRDLVHGQASGRMTDDLRDAAEHVENCRTCEMRLHDERELSRKLATVASANSEPSRLIEPALVQAYSQILTDSRKTAIGDSPVIFRRPAYLFAAAAALLIVFGAVVLRSRLAPPNPAVKVMPAEAGSQDPTRATSNVEVKVPFNEGHDDPDLPPRKLRRVNHRSVKRVRADSTPQVTAKVQEVEPEIATQFIALGAAGPINLQDGGQIVRVELSRLAMSSFGLPVNMDRSGERVKADVLLSADGFARAIRFIQ